MWPNYSPACRKAVTELLKKGGSLSAYRANPQVGVEPTRDSWAWRLEREIEKRFKVRHAVACNSGTGALHAAITATLGKRGITSGDIIVSPYTFSASAAAILHAGYTPVFADVDPYTFQITAETVKRVATKRTVAVLPVHIFGLLGDMRELQTLGLPIIEDFCQAVGASNSHGFAGAQGAVGAASCNGGKNVPAGECGFVTTHDPETAERSRYVMNHGENFNQATVGYNYRPNEVTACIAYHGLLELEERNQRRRDLAAHLRQGLFDRMGIGVSFPGSSHFTIRTPVHPSTDENHVYYVTPFTIHSFDRHRFATRMKRLGIPVGEGYITPPLHKYKAFRKYQTKPLPVVEELSSKTLCILSTLTPDRPLSYADHVADCMRKALA